VGNVKAHGLFVFEFTLKNAHLLRCRRRCAAHIPVACPFMGVFTTTPKSLVWGFKSADKSANYSALHLGHF